MPVQTGFGLKKKKYCEHLQRERSEKIALIFCISYVCIHCCETFVAACARRMRHFSTWVNLSGKPDKGALKGYRLPSHLLLFAQWTRRWVQYIELGTSNQKESSNTSGSKTSCNSLIFGVRFFQQTVVQWQELHSFILKSKMPFVGH